MGKNKAVFLDRDGTINVEKNYVYKVEDFEFISGVFKALRILQKMGFFLIVITNQSGIGRGYYTEKDFGILNDYMIERLREEQIEITDVFFCPHLPDAKIEIYRRKCQCRKPGCGLFLEAQQKWHIDFSRSYAIGDKARDCTICEKTDCTGIIIGTNNQDEKKSISENTSKRIFCASNLLEASNMILEGIL